MTTPEEESGWVEVPVAEGRLFIHQIEEVEVRTADGTVVRQVSAVPPVPWQTIGEIPVPRDGSDPVQRFEVQRGGIQYPNIEALRRNVEHDYALDVEQMRATFDGIHRAMGQFTNSLARFGRPDQRQGEEVYVYDLLPGARVFVLEDVFTVDRVDMDAPLPTVWLKELPTSPLYFGEDEAIYLASETED